MSQILIVDPDLLSRTGLRLALQAEGFIVGEAAGLGEALAWTAERPPGLVVLDIAAAGVRGCEHVALLHRWAPGSRVVVLGDINRPEVAIGALREGAYGALPKNCTLGELVDALRRADKGERVFADDLRGWLSESVAGGEASTTDTTTGTAAPPMLDERETRILQLLADGCSTAEVAERLFLSVHTIRNGLAAIFSRLGARDRNQAVFTAARLGLIELR